MFAPLLQRAAVVRFVLLFGLAASAFATKIEYETLKLAGSPPSGSYWEYRYYVSGRSFAMNEGFTIFFDFNLFGELQSSPPAPNPDWDVLTLQPDLQLPDNGAYDALALVDNASLANPFTVDFVFLASGSPGSQPFTINRFDSEGTLLDTLETGFTVPRQTNVVPEPDTWLLVSGALMAISAARARRRFLG